VGREGIEPPQPKAADLQSAAIIEQGHHEFPNESLMNAFTATLHGRVFAEGQQPIFVQHGAGG
jgi:hypothetical protein